MLSTQFNAKVSGFNKQQVHIIQSSVSIKRGNIFNIPSIVFQVPQNSHCSHLEIEPREPTTQSKNAYATLHPVFLTQLRSTLSRCLQDRRGKNKSTGASHTGVGVSKRKSFCPGQLLMIFIFSVNPSFSFYNVLPQAHPRNLHQLVDREWGRGFQCQGKRIRGLSKSTHFSLSKSTHFLDLVLTGKEDETCSLLFTLSEDQFRFFSLLSPMFSYYYLPTPMFSHCQ